MTSAPGRPGNGSGEAGLRLVLTTLCVTQITSWGVLYYAFPVLAESIVTGTGWSRSAVTAAFSGALVVSALSGIVVGRRLDRHGPRWLMTGGSLLAVIALTLVATAQSFAGFAAGWVLAGASMSAVLYPPAFAAVTGWFGPRRLRALTVLTLVGGLASTVFAPLTAALLTCWGWRMTYLVLAGVLLVVTVPAHGRGLRRAWPPSHPAQEQGAASWQPERVLRSRTFVALVAAMTLNASVQSAGVVNLVALLREQGFTVSAAALVLGLGGAAQLLGRLGYAGLSRRLRAGPRTAAILAVSASATALMGVTAWPPVLLAAALVAGTARGAVTLLQATAVTDRWGADHYGRINGMLSAPVVFASALAPWIGAALADLMGGYSQMFWVLGVLGWLAALVALASQPCSSPVVCEELDRTGRLDPASPMSAGPGTGRG